MAKSTKKQQVNKRGRPAKNKAVKELRSGNNEITISNPDTSNWLMEVKAPKRDTEVASLAAICSILDNWSPEQRKRNLEYIVGKYYDFS